MLDDLERLTKLWKDGALSDAEFEAQKGKLLATAPASTTDGDGDYREEPRSNKLAVYAGVGLIAVAVVGAGVLAYDYTANNNRIVASIAADDEAAAATDEAQGPATATDAALQPESVRELPLLDDDDHAARMCMVGAARTGQSFDNFMQAMYYTARVAQADNSNRPFMAKLSSASNNELLKKASFGAVPDDKLPRFMERCEEKFPDSRKGAEFGAPPADMAEFRFTCFGAAGVLKGIASEAGQQALVSKYENMSNLLRASNGAEWSTRYDLTSPEKVTSQIDAVLSVAMPKYRLDTLASACERYAL